MPEQRVGDEQESGVPIPGRCPGRSSLRQYGPLVPGQICKTRESDDRDTDSDDISKWAESMLRRGRSILKQLRRDRIREAQSQFPVSAPASKPATAEYGTDTSFMHLDESIRNSLTYSEKDADESALRDTGTSDKNSEQEEDSEVILISSSSDLDDERRTATYTTNDTFEADEEEEGDNAEASWEGYNGHHAEEYGQAAVTSLSEDYSRSGLTVEQGMTPDNMQEADASSQTSSQPYNTADLFALSNGNEGDEISNTELSDDINESLDETESYQIDFLKYMQPRSQIAANNNSDDKEEDEMEQSEETEFDELDDIESYTQLPDSSDEELGYYLVSATREHQQHITKEDYSLQETIQQNALSPEVRNSTVRLEDEYDSDDISKHSYNQVHVSASEQYFHDDIALKDSALQKEGDETSRYFTESFRQLQDIANDAMNHFDEASKENGGEPGNTVTDIVQGESQESALENSDAEQAKSDNKQEEQRDAEPEQSQPLEEENATFYYSANDITRSSPINEQAVEKEDSIEVSRLTVVLGSAYSSSSSEGESVMHPETYISPFEENPFDVCEEKNSFEYLQSILSKVGANTQQKGRSLDDGQNTKSSEQNTLQGDISSVVSNDSSKESLRSANANINNNLSTASVNAGTAINSSADEAELENNIMDKSKVQKTNEYQNQEDSEPLVIETSNCLSTEYTNNGSNTEDIDYIVEENIMVEEILEERPGTPYPIIETTPTIDSVTSLTDINNNENIAVEVISGNEDDLENTLEVTGQSLYLEVKRTTEDTTTYKNPVEVEAKPVEDVEINVRESALDGSVLQGKRESDASEFNTQQPKGEHSVQETYNDIQNLEEDATLSGSRKRPSTDDSSTQEEHTRKKPFLNKVLQLPQAAIRTVYSQAKEVLSAIPEFVRTVDLEINTTDSSASSIDGTLNAESEKEQSISRNEYKGSTKLDISDEKHSQTDTEDAINKKLEQLTSLHNLQEFTKQLTKDYDSINKGTEKDESGLEDSIGHVESDVDSETELKIDEDEPVTEVQIHQEDIMSSPTRDDTSFQKPETLELGQVKDITADSDPIVSEIRETSFEPMIQEVFDVNAIQEQLAKASAENTQDLADKKSNKSKKASRRVRKKKRKITDTPLTQRPARGRARRGRAAAHKDKRH